MSKVTTEAFNEIIKAEIPSATAAGSGSKIGFDATRGSGTEFDRITLPAAARERAAAVLAGLDQ